VSDRTTRLRFVRLYLAVRSGCRRSKLAVRCKSCREKAVIEIARHNAAYCRECFFRYCRRQVERAIEGLDMMSHADRVLVAVSGGKDSLALWDILTDLEYSADAVYLDLGIGTYSERSRDIAQKYADTKGLKLHTVSIREEHGFGIPEGSKAANRPTCSLCGMSKRHLLNKFAYEHGYDVLATGHNLDDEAATLLANLVRWDAEYLRRQWPVLPARPGFVRKVKPLIRLQERETAAYCVLSGIEYVVEECPLVVGNTQLEYKEALNVLERRSPGTKARLVLGFLNSGHNLLVVANKDDRNAGDAELGACVRCGSPTPIRRKATTETASEDGVKEDSLRQNPGPSSHLVCAFCRESQKIALTISRR